MEILTLFACYSTALDSTFIQYLALIARAMLTVSGRVAMRLSAR
jgi:hypothetical protein